MMRWRDEPSDPHNASEGVDEGGAAAAVRRTSSLDEEDEVDSSGSPDNANSSSWGGGGDGGGASGSSPPDNNHKNNRSHPLNRLGASSSTTQHEEDGGDGDHGNSTDPGAAAPGRRTATPVLDDSGGQQRTELKEDDDLDPPDPRKGGSSGSGLALASDSGGGSDHAVEEPPGVPWTPQSVQSTCEFTHTIANYAQQRESGCKKAEYSDTTVDEFGNRWRLIIYVNGNGRASNHHLSLFLQVADADDLPFGWKKAVSYVLTLEHPKGGTYSYAKRNPDKTFKLCPKAIDWGWSQFITSDRIQQEGFVADDCLTVRASVTVKSSSVSIEEEDAELYLKCAVEEGDAASVKLCLDQGASVNCKFKDDLYTPLHTACSSGTTKGSIEVLNLLLRERADPNACNKWRETPLLIAANNGHTAACEALLEHGADPSLCSEAGWSALTFAAHKGYDDIVKILLKKGAPVNTRVAEDSSTPLHKACAGSKAGHQASVKLLIDGNADVHALNKWRETPLLTAANHGQAKSVKYLLDAGADPCKCTDTGWSPLSIAAYKGHDEVVRLLLEEGAPTEEEDPTLSALLQAATKGLPDTVELLLKNGADHTVTTKKGDTALSILVEQNLIDAAVDMVTVYNASIPRCSRDRKKVQRARLLINLRMKQLERDSKNQSGSTDEDESDEEGSETSHTSQHLDDSKPRRKRDDATAAVAGGVTAEELARAAEEALLLELDLEAAKAQKDEAEANSKRAKKKKKKEQLRLQKLKEEEDRRQREQKEVEEREKVLREREEKKRKEQEAREQEKREQEIKEMMERQKAMAAKKKERERRERVQPKQREKEVMSASPTGSAGSEKRSRASKPTIVASVETRGSPETGQAVSPRKQTSPTAKKVAPLGGNRRWETKPKSPSRSQVSHVVSPTAQEAPPLPTTMASGPNDLVVPSMVLAPRPGEPLPIPSASQSEHSLPSAPAAVLRLVTSSKTELDGLTVEHPAVSLFRREKAIELLRRLSDVRNVNITAIKRALYRWVVRAAHDKEPAIDPLIPSWRDVDRLEAHFQRQLIAETKRSSSPTSGFSMEALKQAGRSVALICQGFANEIEQIRLRIEQNVQSNWSDASVGTTCQETIGSDGAPVTSLSWENRYTVLVPSSTLAALRERFRGPLNRFLSAVFVAKTWYEARDILVADCGLGLQIPLEVQARLSSQAGVTNEIWSDPFSVFGQNVFWGGFEDVDSIFGGLRPFGKDEMGPSDALVARGGSVSVLPPLDNVVAAMYMKRLLDSLRAADQRGVPLSATIFLHYECFPDLSNGPTLSDLKQLDPRLGDQGAYASMLVEVLPAGQHAFRLSGAPSSSTLSPRQSLVLVLQNVAGRARLPISAASLRNIIVPMLITPARQETTIVPPLVFPSDFNLRDAPPTPQSVFLEGLPQISPDPQRMVHSGYGAIGGTAIGKPPAPISFDKNRSSSRHGRLFDLVDDVEDDPLNDMDLVSGMLNNLDVELFQNGSSGPDIDIEAISLMGIGGLPSQPSRSGHIPQGRFG